MSFDIALSGIQAINEQLNSISNNIANAGTFGFKSSRANFASMYAGTQPTGTQIGSVTQSIGLNGGVLSTGRGLDAAINGRGFFMVKDSTGIDNYTRVGIFKKDANDFLVDSAGRRVQGFKLTPPSTTPGNLGDIAVPTNMLAAKATTAVDFVANLSPDWTQLTAAGFTANAPNAGATPPVVPAPSTYNMSKVSVAIDSLGREHTVTQYFVKTGPTQVTVFTALDGTSVNIATAGADSGTAVLDFNSSGQLTSLTSNAGTVTVAPFQHQLTNVPVNPAANLTIDIDFTGTTFQKGEVTTSTNASDGYPSGSFVSVELQDDGTVLAKYSNGESQAVGIVALATFPDENGLNPVDNTSWVATNVSGNPNISVPGAGVAGTLSTAALEQSNVDITSELVSLMTSQRNYQANSKVITAENQMLQSLMQAL